MSGCSYCGVMHSQLYVCDEMRTARENVANSVTNTPPDVANQPEPMANSTYRYRDADKRRAYMRDYMRKKRNEQI